MGMDEKEMALRAGLARKINAIAAAIGRMTPLGYNEHSKYDFVGYEQMNAKLRELLPQHGVALIPEIDETEERDFARGNGGVTVRSVVKGHMMIVDTDTGYAESRRMLGADQDTGGKSVGKAVTEMVKRFQFKLFHVSTQDDIDPDAMTEELPGMSSDNRHPPRQGQQSRNNNRQQQRKNWP